MTTTAAEFVAERVEESQRNIHLLDGVISRGTNNATREGMYSGFAAKEYAMAYLMEVLRNVAPEIADRAAADLDDALGMGEAAGVDEDMAKALAAGDPAAWNLGEVIGDREDIGDGYHTLRDLYEFRKLYNAALFTAWHREAREAGTHGFRVHKSLRHHDGEIPFGDPDWFIVMATLPTGQISNHYHVRDWALFDVPVRERAGEWDGHTAADVAGRLARFLGEA